MAISKRPMDAAVALLLAVALGAGMYLQITAGASDAEAVDGAASPITSASSSFSTDVAIAVEGAEVLLDTLVLAVRASGEAEAWRRAVLTAEVAGRVARVGVRESGGVAAGDVVLALDPVERQLAVEDARAVLAGAEAQYRQQLLFDGDLPEDVRREREAAARLKSGLDRAEIQLRRARLDLERTRLRAPFPGRVASLNVVPGQRVGQGTELLTLVDIDPVKVQVRVLEGELAHLAPGGSAEIRFSAFPEELFVGRIETVNPLVEQETRTARVTVLVPNPSGRVLPGMYARVRLEAQRLPDRILVPRAAILERDRRTMLFALGQRESLSLYLAHGHARRP